MSYAPITSASHQESSSAADQSQTEIKAAARDNVSSEEKTKYVAEQDADLRLKLGSNSGGAVEAGLGLEDGRPVDMRRGVRENVFRLT